MTESALSDLLDRAEQVMQTEAGPGTSSADRFQLLDQVRNHDGLAGAAPDHAMRVARLLAASEDPSDLPTVAELAGRAHQAGIDGAGLIFAEAVDKVALFQGQPQRYGTVMVEHQGDIVQPPVDPSVTDGERASLGVPSMAELQQRMETVSRHMATERASQPGMLPPGQRFCRVWQDHSPAELRARLDGDPSGDAADAEAVTTGVARTTGGRFAVWADGDVITFVHQGDGPVALTPVFPLPSWDAGQGLHVLSLRVERLDEAVITYTFTPTAGGPGAMAFSRGSHDGRFRGSSAPTELTSNDPLVGTLSDHAVESPALGETRAVTVYRPPGHQPGDDVAVVYATDGNMFAPYARRLDAAIEAGSCPPVVVVAAHAAPMDAISGNVRALEYLAGFDDRRFDSHQRFFIVELAAWAETELGVATDPAKRGIFGCSDGGGHALTTARLHHPKFGHVFAYSTGMPPDPSVRWDPATHPFVHLCAGTLEGGFHEATAAWAGFLHLQDAPHHFTEAVSGHDLIQWCEELPKALARAWG